jgi:integrase
VAKSKTKAGEGRVLPMNAELLALLEGHAERHKLRYGTVHPEHYLFPRRKPAPADPFTRVGSFKKAWGQACKDAGIEARMYDCRHTMLTKLAESGASDSTIMAIAGHLSRRMLERYSHIRMQAKREAMMTVVLPKGVLDGIRTAGSPTRVPTGGNLASQRGLQTVAIAVSGG